MRRILAALLALVMVFALVGCGSTTSETAAEPTAQSGEPGEPVYGGSATIYYQNFNEVFDPAMAESYTYSLWLESLWGPDWGLNDPDVYNFDANVLPLDYIDGQIAESWDWVKNGDGTSDLYVTIRDDIYFQEKDAAYDVFGARNLKAEDVKFSYDRIWGTGSIGKENMASYEVSWTSVFDGIIDFTYGNPVEVVDDYTVVFHLMTESEVLLETFMYTAVNITGVEWNELTEEQRNDWHYACGTGPFVLVGYEPDSYYKYVRNDNYYDYDERHPENRLPYLDSLTLTAVNDAAGIMSSFIAGNLDYVSMDANLTPDQNSQIIDALDGDVNVLYYDSNAAGIALKVNQPPFDDIRVRIALQKAVNLEQVNSLYYEYDTPLNLAGLWIAARDEWSSQDEWDDELVSEYTYDPEGAKALLAEAGYPDGFTFTVALDTNADQDLYLLIKTYFAAIGVTMELDPVSDMQTAHQISGDASNPEDINQNIADLEAIDSAIFMYSTTGMANPIYHTDTEFDAILESARGAETLDDLVAYARTADLRFMESHWIIACSGTTLKTELLSSRIGGIENGERISYSRFTKPFLARIWAIDGQ
ncbi:MAG: ABC transporter substrate-binding protein [Oscillospiraceae bacterium]